MEVPYNNRALIDNSILPTSESKLGKVFLCSNGNHQNALGELTLDRLIENGYSHFRDPEYVGEIPEIPEDEFPAYTFIYANGPKVGTLTLTYPTESSFRTPIDTFFQPRDSNKSTQELVTKTTSLLPPYATIGKLTIGKIDPANPSEFIIERDLDAFMHLSHAAALHVQERFGRASSGVMIARPSLIRILNNFNLRFHPVYQLTLRRSPELDQYYKYYSRYWLKGMGPNVYATSSDDILNATAPYVEKGGIHRVTPLARAILSGLSDLLIR